MLGMSPDYLGVPFYPNGAPTTYKGVEEYRVMPTLEIPLGGGLIETFAFGGSAPADKRARKNAVLPGPVRPFGLAQAIGISSWAIAAALSNLGAAYPSSALNPRYDIWPITTKKHVDSKLHQFGDGGIMENA